MAAILEVFVTKQGFATTLLWMGNWNVILNGHWAQLWLMGVVFEVGLVTLIDGGRVISVCLLFNEVTKLNYSRISSTQFAGNLACFLWAVTIAVSAIERNFPAKVMWVL
jgi:hypothetical protein